MVDESREARGDDDEADAAEASDEVLTLVCLKCGQEYYFADSQPEEGITCGRCGNGVFRNFFTPSDDDDVARDFVDTTERDLDPDDAEGDVLPGDVLDLNRD